MKLLDYLLDWIYPTKCPFCCKLTPDAFTLVCKDCMKDLAYTQKEDSNQSFKYLSSCVAPFYYEKSVRESILRYKFKGKAAYSRVYPDFINNAIDENKLDFDVVTWVPLSRRRFRKRGYDQAKLLAQGVAKKYGKPCTGMLRKVRSNAVQSRTHSREERKANVKGVYNVIDPKLVSGKRILIVDDVVTTGSTLGECARMLRQAGAADVCAAAIARHRD